MPIERVGRPGQDPVDGRIVGVGRDQGRVRDDRRLGRRLATADAGRSRRAKPAVVADLDELDPPIEDIGEAAAIRPAARRGSSEPPRTSSRSFRRGAPGGSPIAAAGARMISPRRSPGGSIRDR
jgi:hypothetical protein